MLLKIFSYFNIFSYVLGQNAMLIFNLVFFNLFHYWCHAFSKFQISYSSANILSHTAHQSLLNSSYEHRTKFESPRNTRIFEQNFLHLLLAFRKCLCHCFYSSNSRHCIYKFIVFSRLFLFSSISNWVTFQVNLIVIILDRWTFREK